MQVKLTKSASYFKETITGYDEPKGGYRLFRSRSTSLEFDGHFFFISSFDPKTVKSMPANVRKLLSETALNQIVEAFKDMKCPDSGTLQIELTIDAAGASSND